MTGSPFCVLGWEDQVHALESLDLSEPWAHALGLYASLLPKVPAFFKKSTFVPIFPYYAHKTLFKQELI